MKSIFARQGIPDEVISDNGPQFACSEFKKFSASRSFVHTTTSPYFAQSNAQIERTVKTVKRMFKKAIKGGDAYLMLLEYRNTPIDRMSGKSPAQLLNSRQMRSNLPITTNMLSIAPDMSKNLERRQAEQKYHHDKKLGQNAGVRKPEVGDPVRFKDAKGEWQYGNVMLKHDTPRSFVVQNMAGETYRRNQSHMFRTRENPPIVLPKR